MKRVFEMIQIMIGIMLMAFVFGCIVIPQSFSSGGVTGLAVLLNMYIPIGVSVIVLILNIVLFVSGGIVIGKDFLFRTLLSAIFFPLFLQLFQSLGIVFTMSQILQAVLGGILLGTGCSLILNANASSGGFDVVGVILHRYFGIPVAVVMYVMDMSIMFLQRGNFNELIYGMILVLLSSVTLSGLSKLYTSSIFRFKTKSVVAISAINH